MIPKSGYRFSEEIMRKGDGLSRRNCAALGPFSRERFRSFVMAIVSHRPGANAAPDLDAQLDRLERMCPAWLAKAIHFLRNPHIRLVRLTAGVLLIIGGLLWFLPILGIEMLPIGIVLIALDVPFLRGPAARMLAWIERGIVWAIALWQAVSARLRGHAIR